MVMILAMILASWRLTEILTMDRISAPLRKKWPVYLLSCPRCVSVWSGLFCGLVWYFYPIVNIPFALSQTYILIKLLESLASSVVSKNVNQPDNSSPINSLNGSPERKSSRHVTIEVAASGELRLNYEGLSQPQIIELFETSLSALRNQLIHGTSSSKIQTSKNA